MSRHYCGVVLLVLASLSWPATAVAGQSDDDRTDESGMRLGVVRLAPTLAFNSGIDTNVFNTYERPRSDLIATVSPRTDAWMRMGPARVSGKGGADFVYFFNTASERTVNYDGTFKVALPLNHIEPYVTVSYLKTRERPSVEIDARSLRREHARSVGTTVRISGRSSLLFDATKSEVRFDAGAVFLETSLSEVLNRDETTIRASLHQRLTPLTALTIGAEAIDQRFVLSPFRDSRSLRIAPELEFGATALITGKASVGYRTFDAKDPSIPDFKGLVASVDLAYTLFGSTHFSFKAIRDLDYSYQFTAPYFVIAGMSGEFIQRVSDSVGISARWGIHRLNYRSIELSEVAADPRVDSIVLYGAGAIHKLGRDLRVRINVDYNQRRSLVEFREYNSIRAGVSVLYGFKS